MSIPQPRFEGDVTELDDRLGRYRTRHDILKKVESFVIIVLK